MENKTNLSSQKVLNDENEYLPMVINGRHKKMYRRYQRRQDKGVLRQMMSNFYSSHRRFQPIQEEA